MQGSLGFSRSDRRRGGTNLARLDRFYVSDGLRTRGGSVGILAGTTFSDHAPVVLVFEEQRRPPSQQLRIPESVSTDLSLSSEIESLWLEARGQDVGIVEQCVLGLRDISLFLHATARRRLEESRERERRLRRGLRSI